MDASFSRTLCITLGIAIAIAVSSTLLFFLVFIYPERCKLPIAKALITLGEVQQISAAVEQYETDQGVLPPNLEALVPQYLPSLDRDIWGQTYGYEPAEKPELRVFSLGADGKKGGVGAAADLYRHTDSSELIQSVYKPLWGCHT